MPPENSVLYHEALKKAGVPTELHLYESGGHGVMNDQNPWKQDMEAWLIQRGILPGGQGAKRMSAFDSQPVRSERRHNQ